MRKIRMTVCVFFVISCVIFGVYMVRTRMMEDRKPPEITCKETSISASVNAAPEELLKGVEANDNKDGDITKSVRISSMSHFIGKGKRTITYVVFDAANQAATLERTLTYTDYVPPRIHLKSPLRYSVNEIQQADLTANMTAEDCLDGDLSNQIRITWNDNVYIYQPGVYPVTLQVNNSAGDVLMIPMDVMLTDNTDRVEMSKTYPALEEYIAYTKVGVPLDLASYLKGVKRGNSVYTFEEDMGSLEITKDEIAVQPQVDYAVPGVYTADYVYTDENGIAAVTKLYIVVEE